jgi:hypothetical protein
LGTFDQNWITYHEVIPLASDELYPTSLFPVEALIEDIEMDKRVALNSLNRSEYQKFARDTHFELHD